MPLYAFESHWRDEKVCAAIEADTYEEAFKQLKHVEFPAGWSGGIFSWEVGSEDQPRLGELLSCTKRRNLTWG